MKHSLIRIFAVLLASASFLQVKAFNYDSTSCKTNNYIQAWGKLKLVGNQLCSESGTPVQLRGWSTHGYQWSGRSCFDDEKDFAAMKGFGANVARIAMYVTEGGSVNPDWIKNCIDWTASQGMYCIVDWHVMTPGTPTSYEKYKPAEFFASMAEYTKAKGYKHVMYEICGNPNDDTVEGTYNLELWADIKSYADNVLPAIAKVDPDAIVIVGTPQGCKDLVSPMELPLENTCGLQVMYSFHYSAYSDGQYLGNLQIAASPLPLFVTEWVTTDWNGKEDLCTNWSDSLIKVCSGVNFGNQLISWCNWSFSTEGGNSRSLNNADKYTPGNLSPSGLYVVNQLRKGDVKNTKTKSTPYQGTAITVSSTQATVVPVEKYDEGGEGVAYHEYATADECNTGDNTTRPYECVDMSYTDENQTSSYIHDIAEGEWISYTLNVEKPGFYRLIPTTDTTLSENLTVFLVDGVNAVRDLADTADPTWKVVTVSPYGRENGRWGETRLKTNRNKANHDFCLSFGKAGQQTLTIGFLSGSSVFGSFRLLPLGGDAVETVADELPVEIRPNPAADGVFRVSVEGEALVQVYDRLGRLCHSVPVAGEAVVNAALPAGLYLVKVISGSRSVVKKLLVF